MIAPVIPRPLAAEGVAVEPMAVEVCELVRPIEPGAAANPIVAEASGAHVGEVSAADMTHAGPAAKMRSAEMTATTEVATTEVATTEVATTEVATATATVTAAAVTAAAACKGVCRETQPAKRDARQEHSCYVGHHDFSPDIGPRVGTRRIVHPNLCLCLEAT
jgi:hypothetical protein